MSRGDQQNQWNRVKVIAKSSPTKKAAAAPRRFAGGSDRKKSRRAEIPQLWIERKPHTWHGPQYIKATLQSKQGYLYLQYRDGETIKSFYLGKSRKPSTTRNLAAARGPEIRAGGKRRRKK